jgi:hypothetical protein
LGRRQRRARAQAAEETPRRKRWCWAHTNAKRIRVTVKVSPSSSMAAAERAVTSKSFRAILPSMSADDVTKLRRYCAENFAASAVFVDSPGERASEALAEVVWLGTRDRTRAVTSHRRSARAVLVKLHIPTAGLKGTWLVLDTDEAVRVAAAHHGVERGMHLCYQEQSAIESLASRAAFSSSVADDAVVQGSRAPREAARAQAVAPRCKEGVDEEDPDVKVIVLGNSHRGGAASSFSSFSFEVLR